MKYQDKKASLSCLYSEFALEADFTTLPRTLLQYITGISSYNIMFMFGIEQTLETISLLGTVKPVAHKHCMAITDMLMELNIAKLANTGLKTVDSIGAAAVTSDSHY